ncbi:MAG: DUF5017 domain-containing protein [Clostridia bacterium]|nr:DUF5017 domain-containing protein [Clostridia bacterium]
MKKIFFFVLMLLAITAVQAQEPIGWMVDTDIEAFQESTIVQQGTYSSGIIVNSGEQANCDFDNETVIPVTTGNTFKMSFWGFTSEFVRVRAKVIWSDNTTLYATNYLGPNTGGWMQFSFEGEVPANITTAKVGIRFYDVAGFVPGEVQYVDDFIFESPIGTPLTINNGDLESWTGLAGEPDNYPTAFAAELAGLSAVLSWTDATGSQLPHSYLIKASTADNITLPADGVPVADDTDLSDGTGAANVAFGTQTFTFSNLEPSTTYYFKIFPYTNGGANINFKTDGTPPAAQVETPDIVVIHSQNFNAGFGNWTAISVTGDQVWSAANTFGIGGTPCARISGFVGGAAVENEDWLISPMINLGSFDNEILTFYSAVGYPTATPQLAAYVSTDYDGGGNPATATWIDLQPVLPDGAVFWEWTASGELDLSGYAGGVYIAFVYACGTDDAATWEVDNVLLTGEGEYVPDPEPTNYPMNFAAVASGQSIALSWTDAVGAQLPAGYLLLASDNPSIPAPADGIPVENDNVLSDGSAALNIMPGAQTAHFYNLPQNSTYYFAIYPYTNSGENINYKTDGTPPTAEATTEETTFLLFTDFNADWGGWTTVSVVGAQQWSRNNTYGLEGTPCALMSGFSGGNNENEDWLISPPIDLSTTSNEVLKFFSAKNYVGPQLELRISTDYNGTGNPNDFTWAMLTDEAMWSPGSFAWTESGYIDLSSFTNNTIYVAFQFFSTATASCNWEIDNVSITVEELPPTEPSNYPENFETTEAWSSDVKLIWDDATGEIVPDGYLIVAANQSNLPLPVDGVPVENDPNLNDGSGAMNVLYGIERYTFIDLDNGDYFFRIFPYTGSGSQIDYKTDGVPPYATIYLSYMYAYDDALFTTFNPGWEEWERVSITGDQVWARDTIHGIDGTPCARISGFSGASFDNEDWLISPNISFGNWRYGFNIIFNSAVAYTGAPLALKLSTDYNGNGQPGSATWTDITDRAIWPVGNIFWEWTNSGVIDIQDLVIDDITIAFVYTSTTAASATWEVDNVKARSFNISGIDEVASQRQVSIFPNPTHGTFTINTEMEVHFVEVYSATGSLMLRQQMADASQAIDISNLKPGFYFVKGYGQADENIFNSRIILQ